MSAKAIPCQLYKQHVSPVGRQMDDELKAGAAEIMSRVAQWQTRGAMRACGPMEFAGDIIFLAMVAETQNDAMFWQRLKRLQLCPIPNLRQPPNAALFFQSLQGPSATNQKGVAMRKTYRQSLTLRAARCV